jgi:hypothetical protein
MEGGKMKRHSGFLGALALHAPMQRAEMEDLPFGTNLPLIACHLLISAMILDLSLIQEASKLG